MDKPIKDGLDCDVSEKSKPTEGNCDDCVAGSSKQANDAIAVEQQQTARVLQTHSIRDNQSQVVRKPKTSTERSRECRARKRALDQQLKLGQQQQQNESDLDVKEVLPLQDDANLSPSIPKKKKTSAERTRRWRERKGLLPKTVGEKSKPKTVAVRSREYRERKKSKAQQANADTSQRMVKEFSARNNIPQIKRLLKVLGQDFATSNNIHTRKGGLIGLAATAVGLGKDTPQYTEELIHPILACFSDTDIHVRYHACESLYNVVKIARGAVLPMFPDIFGALSKLACDPDQSVKNATELLDRLMKDVVTESGMFDLNGFMPLLREQIYTKNPFGRQFVISWVSVLDAVPDMDFVIILPEILDGLYNILEDPTPEIKRITDTVLGEFLRSIKANPSRVDFPGMINILITHAQKTDELLQLTAITWIREFVNLSGPQMLPYTSGILTAILPCLAYDGDNRRNIKDTATQVNNSLMKLITSKEKIAKRPSKLSESDVNDENRQKIAENEIKTEKNQSIDRQEAVTLAETLDLVSVVEVLTKHLMHTSVQTKVAVLKWIHLLFINIPHKMYDHIEELFTVLMRILVDPSDDVVQQTLVVLAEIIGSSADYNGIGENEARKSIQKELEKSGNDENLRFAQSNKYFTKFLVNLLRLFSQNRLLLEERGAFIIRELCVLLSAEKIYKTLAEILLEEQNLRFACIMIQTLNVILLTSSELFELRNKLKNLKSEDSRRLFVCLYESWCHNPVATVALCLLGQNYSHACDLVRSFANIEVTVEFLTEIDKLVQLIESPIFTYLRLELLERERNEALVRTLYGLLMILPQSDAFATLHRRLAAIPPVSIGSGDEKSAQRLKNANDIDFSRLLRHFESVQEKHKEQKHRHRLNVLVEREGSEGS